MSHHCNDWSRAQLLRRAAAKAGAGLPAIEPGMPVPAGTGMSRRQMLLRSAGLALAVYGAGRTLAPQAFEEAVAQAAGDHRVLVSIFLDGGADSLSILAPTGDPRYASLRPTLAVGAEQGWAIGTTDDRLRWAPQAQGFRELWEADGVGMALAPAIGYSSPNGSHFTSRHFWEVGELDPLGRTGWLGRYLDRVGDPNVPIQGLSFSSTLSPTLATANVPVAATSSTTTYNFSSPGIWADMTARMRTTFAELGDAPAGDPMLAYARRVQAAGAGLSRDLTTAASAAGTAAEAGYPSSNSTFKTRLQSLAKLLSVTDGSGNHLPVRAVTLSAHGGWDTHSGQDTRLGGNLQVTGDNIRAFWRDLELRGLADRVVLHVWSEFGRRVQENGSSGTDHGAAGLSMVIGKTVRQGLVGEFPGLAPGTGVDAQGNLRATSDFRALYCSLLEQWFGADADGLIPGAGSFGRPALIGA